MKGREPGPRQEEPAHRGAGAKNGEAQGCVAGIERRQRARVRLPWAEEHRGASPENEEGEVFWP